MMRLDNPAIVPEIGSVLNLIMSQVIGNKSDPASTAATASSIALLRQALADVESIANNTTIITGTSPDTGGTANTSTRIELDSATSNVNGAYDPAAVHITGGTGAGQSRQIWEYDGPNRYAYVNRDWKVTPDSTSEYTIVFYSGNTHVNEGVAQGGGANTITLNTLASAQNNLYLGQMIFIVAGTGADQAKMVVGYVGATKVVTVDSNWIVNPDNTSIYAMLPYPGFVHGVSGVDSASNILSRDVVGNKSDTTAGDSIIALLKQLIATTATITETTGTFSYDETNAAELEVFALAITVRAVIGGIWLDMVNITQDVTIRVYHRIDGTNYRLFQENAWITTDDDGLLIDGFTAYRNIRITLQCSGGGAGNVDVPYAVV